VLIVVFTIVEIVTLVFWLIYALDARHHLLAVIVLGIGLLIEHTISVIAGKHA
jgi:hypothetical protein